MEWNKVKNIMIIMLTLLNLFLLILIVSLSPNNTKSNLEKLEQIMDYRGVEILCEIPLKEPEYIYVNMEPKKIGIEKILPNLLKYEGQLETQEMNYLNFIVESEWVVEHSEDMAITILNIFKDTGFDIEGYYLDNLISLDNREEYFFIQKVDNVDIFNNKINIVIIDNNIKEFIYQQKGIINFVENDINQKLFNASQILLKNITERGTKVIEIRYGVMEGNNRENTSTQTEEQFVWRIVLDDNTIKYYSVLDGEEIIR